MARETRHIIKTRCRSETHGLDIFVFFSAKFSGDVDAAADSHLKLRAWRTIEKHLPVLFCYDYVIE